MSFGEDGGRDLGSKAVKLPKVADRVFAEHHPIGTRLRWASPPMIRVGAYDIEAAPSTRGVVSMRINGSSIVRFIVDGKEGEPVEPVRGQPCSVDE